MDIVRRLFSLNRDASDVSTQRALATEMPLWRQLLLYGTVAVGVIISKGIAQARAGEVMSLDFSLPWLLIAGFLALMTFATIWKQIGADPNATLLVQMSVAAQGGAFWAILLTAVEKAATTAPVV